jgi:hypothetical protein
MVGPPAIFLSQGVPLSIPLDMEKWLANECLLSARVCAFLLLLLCVTQ